MNITDMTIRQIEEWLQQQTFDQGMEDLIKQLYQDPRSGVHKLALKWEKKIGRQRELQEQWTRMSRLENKLRQQGMTLIAGVDEVGRGPIAGPVVAAAVILPEDFYLPGLNDSKQVSPSLREAYDQEIRKNAISIGVGIAEVELIDKINIYQATLHAMREAVLQLDPAPQVTLNDAVTIPDLPVSQTPVIGGDAKSVSIAAASIIAKVARDRMMARYAETYPQYGFEHNAGYGTEHHYEALRTYGPCPIHRRSFKPVSDLIKLHP